jgi:hypothetical protein
VEYLRILEAQKFRIRSTDFKHLLVLGTFKTLEKIIQASQEDLGRVTQFFISINQRLINMFQKSFFCFLIYIQLMNYFNEGWSKYLLLKVVLFLAHRDARFQKALNQIESHIYIYKAIYSKNHSS